jgi:hypothetical protein
MAVACRSLKFNAQARYAIPEKIQDHLILRQFLVKVRDRGTYFGKVEQCRASSFVAGRPVCSEDPPKLHRR